MILTAGGCFYGTRWAEGQQSGYLPNWNWWQQKEFKPLLLKLIPLYILKIV